LNFENEKATTKIQSNFLPVGEVWVMALIKIKIKRQTKLNGLNQLRYWLALSFLCEMLLFVVIDS
jgi:hypothetical protein